MLTNCKFVSEITSGLGTLLFGIGTLCLGLVSCSGVSTYTVNVQYKPIAEKTIALYKGYAEKDILNKLAAADTNQSKIELIESLPVQPSYLNGGVVPPGIYISQSVKEELLHTLLASDNIQMSHDLNDKTAVMRSSFKDPTEGLLKLEYAPPR